MHPRELGTACKSEVWLEDGTTVVAEVPRIDLLRAREGEAVLGVTGGYWTGLAHRLPTPNRKLKDAKFVLVSRAALYCTCSPLAYYSLNKLVVESITNLFFFAYFNINRPDPCWPVSIKLRIVCSCFLQFLFRVVPCLFWCLFLASR